MASSTQTRILEVSPVRPSSPSAQLALPLTFFDIYWLRFPPVKRIYFFKLATTASFNSLILPKLKRSLSLALFHYLPLAGNLTWPSSERKPIILYTPGDAVTLTVAESTADLDRLSSHEIQDAVDLHPYVPSLSQADQDVDTDGDGDIVPVFELQITSFPGQGFSIGYAYSHAAVDGKSAVMFMEAWAHICKQLEENKEPSALALLPEEMLPFYDREVVKDPEGVDMEYLKGWQGLKWPGLDTKNPRNLKVFTAAGVPPDSVRATFELSSDRIRQLRERVLSLLNQTNPPDQQQKLHLSTFVLAYAYTLICLLKAKGIVGNRMVSFGFVVDCRARLDPPIPTNYFGNCITSEAALAEAEVLVGDKGMAFAAERLSELIKGLEKGVLKEEKEKFAKFMNWDRGAAGIWVAGSTRLDFYGVDFGWGTPAKVELTSIDGTGAICMARSKNGAGALEISAVMKRQEMEDFRSLFLNYFS